MKISAFATVFLLASCVLAAPPAFRKTEPEELSDGVVYPDNIAFAPAFHPLTGEAAINVYIPSSRPYRAQPLQSRSFVRRSESNSTAAQKLRLRTVRSSAPSS